MKYEFFLRYRLTETDLSDDELLERLGGAGCTDALVGIGAAGRLALDFSRSSRSARQSIESALKDVRRALPRAQLVEAGPDFVGLTEVANSVGVSRQNLRKLMMTHHDSFPIPIHEGQSSIWHLHDLLQWFRQRQMYQISEDAIETSKTAMKVNEELFQKSVMSCHLIF